MALKSNQMIIAVKMMIRKEESRLSTLIECGLFHGAERSKVRISTLNDVKSVLEIVKRGDIENIELFM